MTPARLQVVPREIEVGGAVRRTAGSRVRGSLLGGARRALRIGGAERAPNVAAVGSGPTVGKSQVQHAAAGAAMHSSVKGPVVDTVALGKRLREPMAAEPEAAAAAPGARKRRADFATHYARRHATAKARAEALLAELPPEAVAKMGGATLGSAQVPFERCRQLAMGVLLTGGGPDGARTHTALRAWRLLQAAAAARSLPDSGLPAEAAFVADIVSAELARAMAEQKGGQGGRTVGATVQEGFVFLEKVVRLPIDASDRVVTAAAAPPQLSMPAPKRHAGSVPIKVYCQLEWLASRPEWSVMRVLARSFIMACTHQNVRLNDALNAIIFMDELSSSEVMRGRTAVASKHGLPLELYGTAEGFLGRMDWIEEHVAEMSDRSHAIPDFAAPRVGDVARATALKAGVAPPDVARKALKGMCMAAPLCMTAEQFDSLGMTTHSFHGTWPDMSRFMRARGYEYSEPDARSLGHWLVDRNAPQPDPRRVPGAPRRNQADGAPVARGGMSFRYTQGGGRRGEREEQLDVRSRLALDVRAAIARTGRSWLELPLGTADWDIL